MKNLIASVRSFLRGFQRRLIARIKSYFWFYVLICTAVGMVMAVIMFAIPFLSGVWYIVYAVTYGVFAVLIKWLFGYFLDPILYFVVYFLLSVAGIIVVYFNYTSKSMRLRYRHNCNYR